MVNIPTNYHHQSYLAVDPSNCSNAYCKKICKWCNSGTNVMG